MRRSVIAALVAGVALAFPGLTGCATEKVSLGGGPREYVASDYSDVLKRWTRSEQLLNVTELNDLLTVTATYELKGTSENGVAKFTMTEPPPDVD